MKFIKVKGSYLINLDDISCFRLVEPWSSSKAPWKIVIYYQAGLTIDIEFYNDIEAKDAFEFIETKVKELN